MSSNSCERSLSVAKPDVDHVNLLSGHLTSALLLNPEFSDVRLLVENVVYPAHRIILAARSDYFRALLFGGMRETTEEEVELKGAPTLAFKALLKYVYSGKIALSELKEEVVLDILGLSHQWGFEELEESICEFLQLSLNIGNVCSILDAGLIFGLSHLVSTCSIFADTTAASLLDHPSFISLSPSGIVELISRDSFCAPEERIFEVACEWVRANSESYPAANTVLNHVRLPLMNLNTLLEVVRPTGLVEPNYILDAIYNQSKTPRVDVKYRGYLVPEENVSTSQKGATVIKGEMRQGLLDSDCSNYDVERGFTRHAIEEPDGENGKIIVQLGQQSILNLIKILLWDRDSRSYSYYVEVSMDQKEWVRVCDYSRYHCRSWQYIYFPQRVVKYIKLVGTHNTVNRMFHVVSLQAYYTRTKFNIDPRWGLLVPESNVALVELGSLVTEGVSRTRNALINGDTKGYDWDSGYTCHQLGSGALVVQLAQPYIISSIRLLLWDLDDRYYSFYVEVSTNQRNWEMVANKSKERCKSWQTLRFKPTPVVYIRIVGTDNSANEVFHCVHFECPTEAVDDLVEKPLKKGENSSSASTPSSSDSKNDNPRPKFNYMGQYLSSSEISANNLELARRAAMTSRSELNLRPPPPAFDENREGSAHGSEEAKSETESIHSGNGEEIDEED